MKPMPPGYQTTTPVPGTGPVGEPGERDPGAPCEGYTPGVPGAGDCESDGHYLCYSDPGCVAFRARSGEATPLPATCFHPVGALSCLLAEGHDGPHQSPTGATP